MQMMDHYDNGLVMPMMGFGTANLTGPVDELVCSAIQAGHRLIDTADAYGSEAGVGDGLQKALARELVKREELFVQTKLAPVRHGYQEVMDGVQRSMDRLHVDYLDAYFLHWPVPRGQEDSYRQGNLAAWQAMVELQQKGLIRYLGVCNFLERHLLYLTESGLPMPAINQLEIHPGFQQRGLVGFCLERGIAIEAWSPMGRGLLQTSAFEEMSARYGKSIGQLALRWSIQKGYVPLTRSSNQNHIVQNIEVFDFEITNEDMRKLDELNSCDNHMDIWSYKRQQMY